MSLSLSTILNHLNKTAKQNQTGPIFCYWCDNTHNFIKYGTYNRYTILGDEYIKIQRYLCKHEQCQRTFSILPHPFLRITRWTLCLFTFLLNMLDEQPVIAELARQFGVSWQSLNRAIASASNILSRLEKAAQTPPARAHSPCMAPQRHWSDFVRMFAATFYPNRYKPAPPTESGNCV